MIPNFFDSVDRMFLTVSLIVALSSLMYAFMGRVNKPIVLGGLIAGVIFNNLPLSKEYFDLASCSNLGDIGIVFFMMLLGAKFDYRVTFARKSNLLISGLSILVPLVCGILISPLIYKFNKQVPIPIPPLIFGIFIGLTISIASLSLVSLFLHHSNLFNQKISQFAMFIASTDNIIFWLIFCVLLVYLQQNNIGQVNSALFFIGYLLLIIFVLPRIVSFITARIKSYMVMLSFVLIGCFLSSVIADVANVHQVFGGFIFGMMIPRNNKYIIEIENSLEGFVNVVLLPIFFANIGAMTKLNVITDMKIIWLGLLIAAIAFTSKFVSVYLSSRMLGYYNRESLFMASLLNIRGAAEIVLLKVGWEIGIISIHVFSILVIMAMVTSWIASSSALYFKRFIT